MRSIDNKYRRLGFKHICGIDEAGRGPWAGPVFCAAVILPENHGIKGIDDSKLLTEKKREELYEKITKKALSYSIVSASNKEVDRFNILGATKKAMEKAVKSLEIQPDFLMVDALFLNIRDIPQLNLVEGDRKSASIAAASILAKVSRDKHMKEMHEKYPEYQFHLHKGYGTKDHQIALEIHGPCPIHRKSFAPIQKFQKQVN